MKKILAIILTVMMMGGTLISAMAESEQPVENIPEEAAVVSAEETAAEEPAEAPAAEVTAEEVPAQAEDTPAQVEEDNAASGEIPAQDEEQAQAEEATSPAEETPVQTEEETEQVEEAAEQAEEVTEQAEEAPAAEETSVQVEEVTVTEETAVEEVTSAQTEEVPAKEAVTTDEETAGQTEEVTTEEALAEVEEVPAQEKATAEEEVTEAEEVAAEEETAVESAEETVEETAETEQEGFTASVMVGLENEGTIYAGDQVIMIAIVNDANMGYYIQWQRLLKGDETAEWETIYDGVRFSFSASETSASYSYRLLVTGNDGTVISSGIVNIRVEAVAEPEEAAEETVEEIVEETIEETVEETVEETAEEIVEETVEAEEETEIETAEVEEIEDYDTALGIDPSQTIVLGDEENEINVREGADGLAAIFTSLPAGAEVTVVRNDGDWTTVVVNGELGYIYTADIAAYLNQEEPQQEKIAETPKKVTIFTSRRTIMEEGEQVDLTSKLEGFEECEEVLYIWKVDKGNGFEVVEGANEDHYSFTATIESLTWNWHLTVLYR